MSEHHPHRLFLASAGTGKTFQLSGHFLRLLLAGLPPESVLATTFTRKAAGEILTRVLTRLLDAVGDAKQRELIMPGLTAEQCEALLAQLARRLDRFSVRTMDAFFVRVAQLFAMDLDLPPGWRIVDEVEDRELRIEALGRVLASTEIPDQLMLLRGMTQAEASRDITGVLLDVVDKARTAYLDSVPKAWIRGPGLSEPLSAEELQEALALLDSAELPENKSGKPDQRFGKARDKLSDGVARGQWNVLDKNGFVAAAMNRGTYYNADLSEDLLAAVPPVALHAAAMSLAEVRQRDVRGYQFLELFERAYQELKRRHGAYRFEDLPRLLTGDGESVLLDERLADLWFRMDARVAHLLLDEFQDTAPTQWRALFPLVDEVLTDQERSFFCVGDVKQSIYGWRGAEPRLLAGMAAKFPRIEQESLRRNFRSSPVVLEAVDAVFANLCDGMGYAKPERAVWREAGSQFVAAYELHEAQHAGRPGAVFVVETDEYEGTDAKPSLVQRTGERVAVIFAEAEAVEGLSVGVLVRTKKLIPALIHELRSRGLRASGEGGNPLTDSEAVEVVLAALHLADHPDDTVVAFHVATSALAAALGLRDDTDAEQRHAFAAGLRARLLREGYGSVVSDWAAVVERDPNSSHWDRSRMAQLIDLALAFDQRAGLRPGSFVDFVRSQKVEDPGGAAVRVMTIHASKGLEFDVVVLPELQGKLQDKRVGSSLRAARGDAYGRLDKVSLGYSEWLTPYAPELAELQRAVDMREVTEALCLLYVAMTRAVRRLEILVPAAEKRDDESFAGLICSILKTGERGEGGVVWSRQSASGRWFEGIRAEAEGEPGLVDPMGLNLRSSERPRGVSRARASAAEPRRIDEILAPRAAGAVEFGVAVHRLFEQLEWLEDFERDDQALLALLGGDEERSRAQLAMFRAALAGPEFAALLSRPSCGEGERVEVRNERRFSLLMAGKDGAESMWNGAIDRLVLRYRGDQLVGAEIVDFKTDAIEEGGLDARVEAHREQLEIYRRVVAESMGIAQGAIAIKLAFVGSGQVREL